MRVILFDNRDKSVHDYYGKNKKEATMKAMKDYPVETTEEKLPLYVGNEIEISEDRKNRDKSYIHHYRTIPISKDNMVKHDRYYAYVNHKLLVSSSIEGLHKKIKANQIKNNKLNEWNV